IMSVPYSTQLNDKPAFEKHNRTAEEFETMIRRTIGYPKAALAGTPIRDLPDVRMREAWEDYARLGDEIREILK
ncbi:MAG: hypothetical protein WCP07_09455, partial [bacterium]